MMFFSQKPMPRLEFGSFPVSEFDTIVVGEGWSASLALGLLSRSRSSLLWISGSGSRLYYPLPHPSSESLALWQELASQVGSPVNVTAEGFFLREFRHKSFSPFEEDRISSLWKAEQSLFSSSSCVLDLTLHEMEQRLRDHVLSLPSVERVEGIPVKKIQFLDDTIQVELASGQSYRCQQVFYADRLDLLRQIEGVPTALDVLGSSEQMPVARLTDLYRKHPAMGAVQVLFKHRLELPQDVSSREMSFGFLLTPNKDSGETLERRIFGSFFDHGQQSIWTMLLTPEESEDNSEITKRLRRIKQTLNKAFHCAPWVRPDVKEFMEQVESEQLRFADRFFFEEGTLSDIPLLGVQSSEKSNPRLVLLTDAQGPHFAIQQVLQAFKGSQKQSDTPRPVNPSSDVSDYSSAT